MSNLHAKSTSQGLTGWCHYSDITFVAIWIKTENKALSVEFVAILKKKKKKK